MSEPTAYFETRGFYLAFSRPSEAELEALYLRSGYLSHSAFRRLRGTGAVGPVLADLHSSNNPEFVMPAYGTGATEAQAAERAMSRWRTEQGD
jgi:hypothetical protein